MSNDWGNGERREPRKHERKERLGVGVGVGVPLAALSAWYLSLNGITMPPGIEASLGVVLGVGVMCVHDFFRDLVRFVVLLLQRKGKK